MQVKVRSSGHGRRGFLFRVRSRGIASRDPLHARNAAQTWSVTGTCSREVNINYIQHHTVQSVSLILVILVSL